MDNEIIIATIGIAGTLGGTVLGWFLNNLSQKGKVSIFIKEWEDKLQYNKAGVMTASHSFEETEYYGYKVSLDLYNSSRDTKIMRNIQIEFADKKKQLLVNVPKDDSTRRSDGHMAFCDDASVINVPAKTVLNVNFHGCVWRTKKSAHDDLAFLQRTDRVILKYTNEKNKEKKLIFKKEIYKDYFTNHEIKDDE
ncbi:MAG: hypothetical protein PHY47_17965 [Lachnospiraceae bacterium]|nr:hypothetical protein [Lachnospiraceae bacterium]